MKEDAPNFEAPWQAQIFALAVLLSERGLFTWSEWTKRLSAEIANGAQSYDAWLSALESLAVETGATSPAELEERREAWDRAARATPHGQPIVLGRGADRK